MQKNAIHYVSKLDSLEEQNVKGEVCPYILAGHSDHRYAVGMSWSGII